jgi:extracellular solute-binding protein, family 1, putative
MKFTKFLAIALSLLMVFGMLASCGKTENPPVTTDPAGTSDSQATEKTDAPATKPVTLKWASWALAEEKLYPTYAAMANTFMEANKDITIEMDGSQAYSTYLDQLIVSAIGGTAPNVAHIKAEWLPQLLETGAVKAVVGISDAVMNDYSAGAISGVTIDGEMVAMPWFANTEALFYNKALLERAGVKAEDIKSWDDLLAAAEKVSALGDDIYGLAFPDSEVETGEGYNILPALWANGGEFMKDGKVTLDTDAGIKTYTQLQEVFKKGLSPKGATLKDLRNMFGQGKIGFYYDLQAVISTCASAAANEEEFYKNFGCMVIPGADANGSGYLVTHLLVVFDTTTDEQMPAMAKFLEHMSSDVVINILYEAGQGKMSSRASVNEKVFANADETTQVYVKAMTTAKDLPGTQISLSEADTIMVKGLSRIANGEDVKTVVSAMQSELQVLADK